MKIIKVHRVIVGKSAENAGKSPIIFGAARFFFIFRGFAKPRRCLSISTLRRRKLTILTRVGPFVRLSVFRLLYISGGISWEKCWLNKWVKRLKAQVCKNRYGIVTPQITGIKIMNEVRWGFNSGSIKTFSRTSAPHYLSIFLNFWVVGRPLCGWQFALLELRAFPQIRQWR